MLKNGHGMPMVMPEVAARTLAGFGLSDRTVPGT